VKSVDQFNGGCVAVRREVNLQRLQIYFYLFIILLLFCKLHRSVTY